MKGLKKLLCFLVIGLVCFSGFLISRGRVVTAFADTPAPMVSYKVELEGGAKFFYMRGLVPIEEDENFMDLESGLYYENQENIYTFDSQVYVDEYGLVISTDGIYLAYLPWTYHSYSTGESGIAISFFRSGVLFKEYELTELTKYTKGFRYSSSHVEWEDYSKRKLDEESNRLSVTTLNNKTIVFDLTSGEIIHNTMSLLEIGIIITIVLIILIVSCFVIYKSKSGEKRK